MRVGGPVLGFLLLGLFAGAARAAEEPPRLGVVALPAPGLGEDERLTLEGDLLAAALEHSGAGFAWRLQAFSGAQGGGDEGVDLAELGRLVEAGKKAYRYLKLEEAQQHFERAAALLGRRPLLGCQAPQVAQLYLYWARAVLDGGDAAGAQALLTQVPRFDPKAVPDPALMPPNLVATFDLALDDRRGRSRGQVLVQSGPGRARLHLDCQVQSAGVVQWNGVAGEGLWVAAEVEGGVLRLRLHLAEGARRELGVWSGQPGEGAALRAQLARLAKGASPLGAAGRPAAELDRVAALTGVELLLLAAPAPGEGMRLGLYRPGRGLAAAPVVVPLSASGRADPDALGVALAELATLAHRPDPQVAAADRGGPSGQEAPPDALPPPSRQAAEDEGPATPWYETWWFWTAAGGVVAAGLVTGLVLGLGGSSEPSGDVVITLGR